tara:strand:+ start:1959 stop:2249 length:291 start_codon:yes stop_codon:yes gene_type:complete
VVLCRFTEGGSDKAVGMGDKGLEIGRQYRPVGKTLFGRVQDMVLQIDKIEVGPGRIPHARLVNLGDPKDTRLISAPALLDTRLYVEVKPAPPPAVE